MKVLLQTFLFFFFLSCRGQTGRIIPLPILTEVDSFKHDGRISTYRTDYFLIKGNSINKDSIRLYVENNLDSSFLTYNQYDMQFYRESENLNLEKIKKYNNKYKAVEGERPITIYSWFNGKLIVH
jgi:hypothetical protein